MTVKVYSQSWEFVPPDGVLLESESGPLVSEAAVVGGLCATEVLEDTDWVLVSDPSLSWLARFLTNTAAEESGRSGTPKGDWGSFGDRCLFNSTAFPTAHRNTNEEEE